MTTYSTKDNDEIVYFATLPTEDIGPELKALVDDLADENQRSGWYSMMKQSYNAYYGLSEDGQFHLASNVFADGRQGELTRAKINHYRNLIQHVLVMATSNRPAFEPHSTNSDPKALEQTFLAKGILEYYLKTRRLEEKLYLAAESALVLREGYIGLDWDPTKGDPYMRTEEGDTEEVTYSGDVVCRNYTPFNVFKDPHRANQEDDWIIVRDWENRFELIAQYPDLKDVLIQAPSKDEVLQEQLGSSPSIAATLKSDLVPVYRFYHRRTSALPEGRVVAFVDADSVLYDSPLPYKELPIYRIAPGEMIETNSGYTTAFDTLSIQKIIDALHSIILSNQSSTGVQLIWVPQGADLDYRKLSEGLNVISTPISHKPESIQLTNTAKETFEYLELMMKQGELLWAVSSVNRGQPEKSLRTGSALALVQAMSVQFNSGFQRSWAHLLSRVGTGIIQILKDYATTPQIAMIVGQRNQSYLKAFTNDDLKHVDLVTVSEGSPLSQTTAGRIQMADTLLERGIVKNVESYTQVLNSGKLEPLLEGQMSKDLLIRRENQELTNGKQVPVMPTDNPILHLQGHSEVLASPEARQDPVVFQTVMKHIQQHVEVWKELSTNEPNLLLAMGIQPIAPVPPEQQAPQPQQGPGGTPANMDLKKVMQAPGAETEGQPSPMPSAPENPETGKKMDIPIPE